MSDQEYEVKPIIIKDDKIEEYAKELLGNWKQYKELKKRMELLDASIKLYMINNNLTELKCDKGHCALIKQTRNALDRTLIKDIEQYKVTKTITLMFKSPKMD